MFLGVLLDRTGRAAVVQPNWMFLHRNANEAFGRWPKNSDEDTSDRLTRLREMSLLFGRMER